MSDTMYVYVIGHDDGPQKIGISNHPPTRAKALKVAGQPHYKVHFAAPVSACDALGIEGLAHWILRDAALGRERFDVTPSQAEATILDAIPRYAAGERVPPREDLAIRILVLKLAPGVLSSIRISMWIADAPEHRDALKMEQ